MIRIESLSLQKPPHLNPQASHEKAWDIINQVPPLSTCRRPCSASSTPSSSCRRKSKTRRWTRFPFTSSSRRRVLRARARTGARAEPLSRPKCAARAPRPRPPLPRPTPLPKARRRRPQASGLTARARQAHAACAGQPGQRRRRGRAREVRDLNNVKLTAPKT